MQPGAATVEGGAEGRYVGMGAPADPGAGLKQDKAFAELRQLLCGRQSGHAGADDHHVCGALRPAGARQKGKAGEGGASRDKGATMHLRWSFHRVPASKARPENLD